MPESPPKSPRSDAPRGTEVKREPACASDDVFDPLVDGAAQLENRLPSPPETTPARTAPPAGTEPGKVQVRIPAVETDSHTANWYLSPEDNNPRPRRTPFPDDDEGD